MTPPVATNMILMSREDSGKRKAGRTALVRELIGKYDKDKDGALSREEIGFSSLSAWMNAGGQIPHERVLNSMRLFADRVIPRLT